MPAVNINKDQKVIIAGSGVFGLSTAYHLIQRGWSDVTVYDKAQSLPAPDAASTDMNKAIRPSYPDPVYTKLTLEAMQSWKNTEIWGNIYHESGILIRGEKDSFTELSLKYDLEHGVRIKEYDASNIQDLFGDSIPLGITLADFVGYLNIDSGWASAQRAMEIMLNNVSKLGGRIVAGKGISGITGDGKGVVFEDGSEEKADLVVIALGSWTPFMFSKLGLNERVIATGHSMATIQLSPEEAKKYAKMPIVIDYSAGFYMFPPHPDTNIIKVAYHFAGFTHFEQSATGDRVSNPRTFMTHENGGAIPRSMIKILRDNLKNMFPELAKLPFSGTRLCWYADTIDSGWLIDFHPEYPDSVIFATGGSGHAFKFLPMLGRLVADRIENTLEPALAQKFSFGRFAKYQTRLGSETKELNLSDLCTAEDLLP